MTVTYQQNDYKCVLGHQRIKQEQIRPWMLNIWSRVAGNIGNWSQSSFHQFPALKPEHLLLSTVLSTSATRQPQMVVWTRLEEFRGGQPVITRKRCPVVFSGKAAIMQPHGEGSPCLVMGFPWTSYILDLLETDCAGMHSKDSHCFLPVESPANTIRPFRLLSKSSLASNLRWLDTTFYQNGLVHGILQLKGIRKGFLSLSPQIL